MLFGIHNQGVGSWVPVQSNSNLIFSFILGAIITPTFDPINQIIVALPIMLLYEVGILLSRIRK